MRPGNSTFKLGSGIHTFLYKVSVGRIGSKGRGLSFLLLTVRGRRSGRYHTVPLQYFEDEDKVVVVASKGGHPEHPDWYLNLAANPDVTVQIGRERIPMRAATASADERARIWPQVVSRYSAYEKYQRMTRREIPIVLLSK